MSKVAVVILNYNGEKFLRQFLPAVILYSKEAEIVVADNASTDKSVSILEKEFPSVRIISLPENYGFCGGYNKALSQVEADYCVLLNSDVEVTDNWLPPMIHLLDQNPAIAAVQPKIKSFHQKELFEYAGAAGGYLDSLGYPFCRGRLFDVLEEDKGQYNDVKEVFWATGACMMVRAEVYHQLAGLDDDFFAHMEEIDLCWRMKKLGYAVYYQGASTVYHVGGGTLSKLSPKKTFLNFRNGLYLVYKNFSRAELMFKLPLRLLLDWVAALRFILSGQVDHAREIFRAHYFFIGKLQNLTRKRRLLSQAHKENTVGRYGGSIVLDFFLRGKRSIPMD